MEPLLRVSNLNVKYVTGRHKDVPALRNINFSLEEGETLGITGASGSGKTTLALALLGLLPARTQLSGEIDFQGKTLNAGSKEIARLRGSHISMIFQEPALALNPVLRVGKQLLHVLRSHGRKKTDELRREIDQAFREAGLANPARIAHAYPHQLSGGERQRVAIAQALVCRPRLLLADEPLSSLDPITQEEVLELLQRLKRELHLSLLFITHSSAILSAVADRVLIIRAGEIVASGNLAKLREKASDAYVQELLSPAQQISNAKAAQYAPAQSESSPLLQVAHVSKRLVQSHFLFREKFAVYALRNVNLEIQAGTTTALIGESGSGKSTLARCIAGFESIDTGQILFNGSAVKPQVAPKQVQLIFQDAATALNPLLTVAQLIGEPLALAKWGDQKQRERRVIELMEEVELDPDWRFRLPHQFSGGQKQRIAIARALSLNPQLLIFDEALSGLELPLQARMVQLLLKLQSRYRLSYLYISHDLNFLSFFAGEIAVMHEGTIVERLAPKDLPRATHPHTQALFSSSRKVHAAGLVELSLLDSSS
ncbi:MAG TPA: ABC transporter ATP-binding protein [Terriglobales bacterium]